MAYTQWLPSKDSGSHREIQNDKIPINSLNHSNDLLTKLPLEIAAVWNRRSEQFAGWSENNFCQVDRKEHWKNCRCAMMCLIKSWNRTINGLVIPKVSWFWYVKRHRKIIKLTIAIQASFALLRSSKKHPQEPNDDWNHIFPDTTCNNNSTNKKPQRSIVIHRLLTFSFAACGNTTGPWRHRFFLGKPMGSTGSFSGISGSYIPAVPMLGVLKSCEKKRGMW